jgi:PAS domain S-box-containing protein
MKLDARTIVILLILGNVLVSGGLLAVSRGYLGQIPGLKRWGRATLLQVLGWVLFGLLRPVVPDMVSTVIGICAISLSLGLYWVILAEFNSQPQPLGKMLMLLGLQAVLLICIVLFKAGPTARIVVNSSVAAILMLNSAAVLWPCKGVRPASVNFMIGMLAFCGCFLAFRASYHLLYPLNESQAQFGVSLINDISYLVFFATAIFLTFGFLLMCNDRYLSQQNRAQAEQRELERQLRASFDALKASEMRLRRLMNSSLIGIIQGNADGSLKEANDVLLHMTGYRHSEMIVGRLNWFELTGPTFQAAQRESVRSVIMHGGTVQCESQLRAKDGSLIPVMLGIAPLEGSHHEWVGFVVDLREQRRIDHLQSEFISIVSHELRTPLTSIRGSLGLLEGGVAGELPAKAMQLVMIAHKNSQRLMNLVNDILDMEKLASGKMTMEIVRLDLVAVARAALEANLGYADGFGVRYQLSTALPEAWVMADNHRLMQVFANLLSNAAKFSGSGKQVELRVVANGAWMRVEIEDHGKGIPESFRAAIFGKFAQADAASTRHLEGAGLGLHITRTLIEKMEGRIGFESSEGVGTTFWFELPGAGHE